jgi:acetoin utilization protein AcuB
MWLKGDRDMIGTSAGCRHFIEANMDENEPKKIDREEPLRLQDMMQRNVIRATMDTTLGEAVTLCFQHRIRHLPILNSQGKLAGIVTDRDLRFYISHRLGTIMENNADRETLHHHLHVMMVRRVITGRPEMTLADATQLMLDNHIGCLPVVDPLNQIVGIVTANDFLHMIATGKLSRAPVMESQE